MFDWKVSRNEFEKRDLIIGLSIASALRYIGSSERQLRHVISGVWEVSEYPRHRHSWSMLSNRNGVKNTQNNVTRLISRSPVVTHGCLLWSYPHCLFSHKISIGTSWLIAKGYVNLA